MVRVKPKPQSHNTKGQRGGTSKRQAKRKSGGNILPRNETEQAEKETKNSPYIPISSR